MSDFRVRQYGTDFYGRPVFQTVFYHDWELTRWANLGFSLPVAQGGFMTRVKGGGAAQSGGAHDEAGSTDYIIEHLAKAQVDAVVWEFRTHGGAANRRGPDPKHGAMPIHLHNTLGADFPLSPMAHALWASYEGNGDGLAAGPGRLAGAPDYERRPNPLVLTPPEEDMNKTELLDVLNSPEGQAAIATAVWKKKIVTADAPTGRYADGIIQRLHNVAFPKKK